MVSKVNSDYNMAIWYPIVQSALFLSNKHNVVVLKNLWWPNKRWIMRFLYLGHRLNFTNTNTHTHTHTHTQSLAEVNNTHWTYFSTLSFLPLLSRCNIRNTQSPLSWRICGCHPCVEHAPLVCRYAEGCHQPQRVLAVKSASLFAVHLSWNRVSWCHSNTAVMVCYSSLQLRFVTCTHNAFWLWSSFSSFVKCQTSASWWLWHLLVHAGLFWWFHNPPNSDMDYRIFNVRMCSFCMHTYIYTHIDR